MTFVKLFFLVLFSKMTFFKLSIYFYLPRASTKALSAGLVSCKAFICCNAYISGIIKGLICSSKLDFNGDCGGNADLVKFNILKKEKEFTYLIHFEIMRNLADQSPISDWTQIQKKMISSVCDCVCEMKTNHWMT